MPPKPPKPAPRLITPAEPHYRPSRLTLPTLPCLPYPSCCGCSTRCFVPRRKKSSRRLLKSPLPPLPPIPQRHLQPHRLHRRKPYPPQKNVSRRQSPQPSGKRRHPWYRPPRPSISPPSCITAKPGKTRLTTSRARKAPGAISLTPEASFRPVATASGISIPGIRVSPGLVMTANHATRSHKVRNPSPLLPRSRNTSWRGKK